VRPEKEKKTEGYKLMPAFNQSDWMWCNKCQGLTFAGNPSLGPCPAGGNHNHTGSVNYHISADGTPVPNTNQGNWRWCKKCQWLTFAGNSSLGSCPAGGDHNHTGSADYILLCNTAFGSNQQPNWRWCNKCQGLTFAGNPSLGPCPAGGDHNHTGSSDYILYSPDL
jgi:hypothetical protein